MKESVITLLYNSSSYTPSYYDIEDEGGLHLLSSLGLSALMKLGSSWFDTRFYSKVYAFNLVFCRERDSD